MTEKVCKLYEEEQVGKAREERKSVPTNKMPDLGWDIAETQLQGDEKKRQKPRKAKKNIDPHMTPSLQAIIAVIIMLVTILEHITTHVKEIPKLAKRTAQAVKNMTTKVSQNKLFQNIKDSYKTATLALTIVTNMMDRTNCSKKNPPQPIEILKFPRTCENSMMSTADRTSRTIPAPPTTATTNMTSYSTVPINSTQRPNREMEIPKHKTLNTVLVPTNEASSTTWNIK